MTVKSQKSSFSIARIIRLSMQAIAPSETRSLNSFLKRFFSRLSIRQKICYGYALAISIAVLGTLSGRIVENFYEHRAMLELNKAQNATKILNKLQAAILHVKNHERQTIIVSSIGEGFEADIFQLQDAIAQVNKIVGQADLNLEINYASIQNKEHQRNYENLKQLIKDYKVTVQEYSQQLEALLKRLNSASSQPEQVRAVQRDLRIFTESEVSNKFSELSQKVSALVESFHDETEEEFNDYHEAETLGTRVLAGSLLVSVLTAAALAIYTSRAIARPLEATTQIAQQVTEEANFNLQAPVTTEDEVGVLTNSLNHLIQRVAAYTRELKQAQAQLIQTEKMSSLGQMVAGIAHEINNPVSFIYGNLTHAEAYMQDAIAVLRLYQQHYPQPDPEIQEAIDALDLEFACEDLPKTFASMKNGAERIRQIVLSLRNFSRLDESEVKAVDLHEGIDSTLVIFNNRLKDNISVIKQYGQLPLVECQPAQLNQVFANILDNAIDALKERSERFDKEIIIQTEPVSADRVRVTIRDNGVGIAAEIKDKIFDPFFTTKPVGKGTGVGLSIAYQIVKTSGGQVEVTSQVGEGTEVAILLPVKQQIAPTGSILAL